MTTYSTDVDAVGTLLTTEWGNPPQLQPAGVPNFQGYGASGQGIEEVYPYLYNPTVDVPPLDESEGGLNLQEQEWVGEVQYLQAADPKYLAGANITADVPFENPLDTLNENAISVGTHIVDYDRSNDVVVGPIAYGVEERTEEVAETPSAPSPDVFQPLEASVAPEVAPEASETPVEPTEPNAGA